MSRILLFSKTPSTSEGVLHIPILKTHYLPIPSNIYSYDIIIITSKEAVNALVDSKIDPSKIHLSTISEKTAQYARENNFNVESVARGYAKYFHILLKNRHKNRKLFYLRAKEVASESLLVYDNAVIYETSCSDVEFNVQADDILIFTSPSAIECFLKKATFNSSNKIICIGRTTQAALEENIESYLADEPSIEACIDQAKELLLK